MSKVIIAHRGNVQGKNVERENTLSFIDEAFELGYLCEVDLWKFDNDWFLSHDDPYVSNVKPVNFSEIEKRKDGLIIHCKNDQALAWFTDHHEQYHYFWHENDDYTLTSFGCIWAYPDVSLSIKCQSAITVMPENEGFDKDCSNFTGICTDYADYFNRRYNG